MKTSEDHKNHTQGNNPFGHMFLTRIERAWMGKGTTASNTKLNWSVFSWPTPHTKNHANLTPYTHTPFTLLVVIRLLDCGAFGSIAPYLPSRVTKNVSWNFHFMGPLTLFNMGSMSLAPLLQSVWYLVPLDEFKRRTFDPLKFRRKMGLSFFI